MIQRLRGEKGFTLIELMIVIAIIGILAAIAIPNFIAYRDKAFCSAAESDAGSIAAGLADYFSIPSNVSFTDVAGANPILFPGSSPVNLSGTNTGSIAFAAGPPSTFTISVTDVSARCPLTYQAANPVGAGDPEGWSGVLGGTFTKVM